jgi:hypothetical protein
MKKTGSVARLMVAVAIGLGPAACSVAPSLAPSSTASLARSAPPASVATSPTASAPPPASALIGWRQLPPQDELTRAHFNSVEFAGDRYLGLGCMADPNLGCIQPAVWESADGLTWRTGAPVFLAPEASGGSVSSAVVSRLGTIAAGNVRQGDKIFASIWLHGSDGWAQITPQAAADATIGSLLATDGRVIAVGSGAFTHFSGLRAWWSADGTTWQSVPPPRDDQGGYPIELLAADGTLLAWGSSCSDVCPVLPSAWWGTVDGADWQNVDAPRGLEEADINEIGQTEGGFVAFGTLGAPGEDPRQPAAWVADEAATDWRPVEPPPQPAGASIHHHLLVGHGSVAAGYAPAGLGRDQPGSFIWLRGPGEASWRTPLEIPDFSITAVFQHPDQLNRIIVLGSTFEDLEEHIVTWSGLVEWAP